MVLRPETIFQLGAVVLHMPRQNCLRYKSNPAEVGIYKRKIKRKKKGNALSIKKKSNIQEKKERKHATDQEKKKDNTLTTKKKK